MSITFEKTFHSAQYTVFLALNRISLLQEGGENFFEAFRVGGRGVLFIRVYCFRLGIHTLRGNFST